MRLVTRGDLDGLTCAVLLSSQEDITAISLIHPQDISDGRADIRPGDIIANLPYHPGCAMWFDHHLHTAASHVPQEAYRGAFAQAPSAAHLVNASLHPHRNAFRLARSTRRGVAAVFRRPAGRDARSGSL